jgi:hypothetical protein
MARSRSATSTRFAHLVPRNVTNGVAEALMVPVVMLEAVRVGCLPLFKLSSGPDVQVAVLYRPFTVTLLFAVVVPETVNAEALMVPVVMLLEAVRVGCLSLFKL